MKFNKRTITILCILLVAGGGLFLKYRDAIFSKEILRLEILGPENVKAGEEVESPPVTFTTRRDEDPPVISQVTSESTLFPGEETRIQTLVGWLTDELAQCAFHYSQGLGGGEAEDLPEETEPVLEHVSVVTELQPATVYRFWITCRDKAENEGRSEDFVLFTPEREKNIIDLILENFESTFGWVRNLTGN